MFEWFRRFVMRVHVIMRAMLMKMVVIRRIFVCSQMIRFTRMAVFIRIFFVTMRRGRRRVVI
jgi:hypothetical protein